MDITILGFAAKVILFALACGISLFTITVGMVALIEYAENAHLKGDE